MHWQVGHGKLQSRVPGLWRFGVRGPRHPGLAWVLTGASERGMQSRLPNQLTALRLLLALLFFLVLNQYRYPVDHVGESAVLLSAVGIFLLAALTDWADGYLARLWQAETTFGRIMDPFCDKVLVIGAFIYLSGPRFVNPDAIGRGDLLFDILPGNMISGFYPWMVAAILARELLVTGIRGELESAGMRFGAKRMGKLKTVFQLLGVPAILLIVWADPAAEGHFFLRVLRDILVYGIVLITLVSGIPYITGAVRAMRGDDIQ